MATTRDPALSGRTLIGIGEINKDLQHLAQLQWTTMGNETIVVDLTGQPCIRSVVVLHPRQVRAAQRRSAQIDVHAPTRVIESIDSDAIAVLPRSIALRQIPALKLFDNVRITQDCLAVSPARAAVRTSCFVAGGVVSLLRFTFVPSGDTFFVFARGAEVVEW
jgi:hypothetical protein